MSKLTNVIQYEKGSDVFVEFTTEKDVYLVRFNWAQSCCESFDIQFFVGNWPCIFHFFSQKIVGQVIDSVKVELEELEDTYGEDGWVAWIVFSADNEEEFGVRLSNRHNGYYGHSWDLRKNGIIVDSGTL